MKKRGSVRLLWNVAYLIVLILYALALMVVIGSTQLCTFAATQLRRKWKHKKIQPERMPDE